MTQFAKTILLLSVSALTLTACSGDGKGPGKLGSKDDIVVQNNGMPQAQAAATTTAANGITSTVENVQPNPAPAVAAGEPLPPQDGQAPAAGDQTQAMAQSEPLPSTDPAVAEAAKAIQEQKTPGVTTTATPTNDTTPATTAPETDTTPQDIVAKDSVRVPAVPAPAAISAPDSVATSAAPSAQVWPAPTPVPAPVAAAAAPIAQTPVPAGTPVAAPASVATPVYPAATPVAATPAASVPSVASIKTTDPAVIKSVQAALRLKGVYKGAETGKVDSEFLNALSIYQGQNKLPPGGLNNETLISLGIAQ